MSEANLFEQNDKPSKRKALKPSERMRQIAVQQAPTLVEVIARIASDPAVNTDKMRAVIEIQRETEAKQQFHDAMVAMDETLPKINRDGKIAVRGGVLHFASFENINKVIKPILRQHGFRMNYQPDVPASGQGIVVHCHLTRGLYSESCTVPVPSTTASPAMNAQQAVGAAISYAKRYGTIALLNLETEAPEDRDTDTRPAAEEKTINGSQQKKVLKAIEDNNVPFELIQKHYLEPLGITAVHELPASQFDKLMASCENHGKRTKR